MTSHLLTYGLPAEIIEWKYFDRQFRPGRERGYVWLKDGQVRGIIGLIPFTLGDQTEQHDCSWTCDWFVAVSERNPGIGALLLKRAIDEAGLLTTLGGNEATSRMVPRMAAHSLKAAGFEWVKPIRLGGVRNFRRVATRLPRWALGWLEDAPLEGASRTAGSSVRVAPGVHASALEGVLAGQAAGRWVPQYDVDYVDWQIGRCPAVECATIWTTDPAGASAAVIWRALKGRQWRIAVWSSLGAPTHAQSVLGEAVRQVRLQGGFGLSAVVAEGDGPGQQLFEGAGFRRTPLAFPLYVLGTAAAPVTRLGRLSYLDSDLAYRF